MTETQFKLAVELDRRSQRLRQNLISLHDTAEGKPSRMDPLSQEEASKQSAVRLAIASERVPLSIATWEQIYAIIESDLKAQIQAIDSEFSSL